MTNDSEPPLIIKDYTNNYSAIGFLYETFIGKPLSAIEKGLGRLIKKESDKNLSPNCHKI